MKRNIQGLIRRPNRKAISLIAAIMMALPISASVLCISPGGHVAIENLNAHCCASLEISGREKPLSNNVIGMDTECLNCTDLFILSNEPGTIRRCYDFSASGAFADESSRKLLEIFAASRSLPQKEYAEFLLSPPASSVVPLRC